MALPFPRDQLITRKEIRILTGCSINQLNWAKKNKELNFPNPVCIDRHRVYLFDKKEMMEWISKNDLKGTIPREFFRKDYKEEISVFDNSLAQQFIRRKA